MLDPVATHRAIFKHIFQNKKEKVESKVKKKCFKVFNAIFFVDFNLDIYYYSFHIHLMFNEIILDI